MAQAIIDREFIDDASSSAVDGDLVKYEVEYSTMNVPNPNIIEASALGRDLMGDEFYDANGSQNVGGDDFYDATSADNDTFAEDSMPDNFDGPDEDFSNLTLMSKKKRAKLKKNLKKLGKDVGKLGKAGLAALTAPQGGATARTMAPPPPPPPAPKSGWAGLSGGAKAAIIVSGLAVVGTAAYFMLAKKK